MPVQKYTTQGNQGRYLPFIEKKILEIVPFCAWNKRLAPATLSLLVRILIWKLRGPQGSSLLDGVDSDVLEVVDSHWQQFPPQHPLINHLVGLSYFVLWIINVLGKRKGHFILLC